MHLGYYLSWFSAVESRLTILIAMLTDSRNLENFDLLARSAQPRRKVELLQTLAKKRRPIGPNFQNLLSQFYEEHIPLRNDLSHSRLVHAKSPANFCLTTISKMNEDQGGEVISSLDLFARGYWLHNFQDDMGVMMINGFPPERLEINDPKTPLRRPSGQDREPPKTPATPGRRDRKRQRKGQPPRGKAAPA